MKNKLGSLTMKLLIAVVVTVTLGLMVVSAFPQGKQNDAKKTKTAGQDKQGEKDKKTGQGSSTKRVGIGPIGPKGPCMQLFEAGENEPTVAMNVTGGRMGWTSNLRPLEVTVQSCNADFELPVKIAIKKTGTWYYRFVLVPNSVVTLANPADVGKLTRIEVKEPCEEHTLTGRLRINRENIKQDSNYIIQLELLEYVGTAGGNSSTQRQSGSAVSAEYKVKKTFNLTVVCPQIKFNPVEIKPAVKPTPIKK